MRILHVITSLQTGGAEHLLVDLLPLLRDHGRNRVDLLLFDGSNTPFMDEIRAKGIKVYKLGVGGNVYSPLNVFKMVEYMAQYDIIHTHNTACQFFAPMAKSLSFTRKPLITTEHSSNNRRRSNRFLKPADKWMYSRYARIICISEQTRKNLEDYIGKKENICTICNGVDTQRFIRPIKEISGQGDFVVTMVAGLRMEKDHETLLRAMTRLPRNYRLQIVGSGDKEQALKALCNELKLDDRVDFMGVRMDVPDILEQSDIVVLSSHWEGLSLSSIEGMASGRPFIASDVDGLREVVEGAGLLFPHGDDQRLAQEIMQLCENPQFYKEVATKCQQRAKQFDISVMAKQYVNLYKSLT